MTSPPVLPVPSTAPAARRKGRKKFVIISLAGVVVVAAAVYWALRPRDMAVSVQTEKIARRTITETVVANGKIYPVVQVHISPEVSGEITNLPVKEGQFVHKGDLLLQINQDVYVAQLNQAKAGYESSLAAKATATANLEKADTDYVRNKELFDRKLLSESDFIGFKVARDVALAQVESADDQVNVSKASVDNAQDLLNKTTITSPLDGTITTLNSQLGERVLGTVQNAGTEIMIISDLSAMEARVDIGEMDVVLVRAGQNAKLDVDSYKDHKFSGVVSAVANSSEGLNASSTMASTTSSSSSGQSATQFQVRIRITETEAFRPGMSVTATIETRTRTNAIAAPIASVTARVLKPKPDNKTAPATNAGPANALAADPPGTNAVSADKKAEDKSKPVDVVFLLEGDHVKIVPVKIGIFDDDYYEITDGLKEGDEIVVGSYHAVSHDLEDGKKVVKGGAGADAQKPKL
jgi:HlyD family secretion protein